MRESERAKVHMIKLENVEHCGGEPEQAASLHMNRLSFTLKLQAESLVFMSVIYARPLPPGVYNFVRSTSSLPLMVSR